MDTRLIILWLLGFMVIGCSDPSPTPIVTTLTTSEQTENSSSAACQPLDLQALVANDFNVGSSELEVTLSEQANGRSNIRTRLTQQTDEETGRTRRLVVNVLNGKMESTEMIAIADETVYVKRPTDEEWSILNPADARQYLSLGAGLPLSNQFLLTLPQGECIGAETQEDGTTRFHHRYDTSQISPEAQDIWTTISGVQLDPWLELWSQTVDGKPVIVASAIPFTNSRGTSLLLEQTVSQINQPIEIKLPRLQIDVADIPQLADAFLLPATEWRTVSYVTDSSPEEINQFYEAYFFDNYWSASEDSTLTTAGVTFVGRNYERQGQTIFVGVGAGEGNQVVTIKEIQSGN